MTADALHNAPATGRARTQFTSEGVSEWNRQRWAKVPTAERSRLARYARSKRTHWPSRKHPVADLHALASQCCPTTKEVQSMLADLAAVIGTNRTAAVIGLSPEHLSHLSEGRVNASLPLKKHVWLVWFLLLSVNVKVDGLSLLTTGRFTPSSGPQHAGRIAALAASKKVGPTEGAGESPDASQGKPERSRGWLVV